MSEAVPSVRRLLDLSGRTAIVTGASGGIGAGLARRFGEAGANVVCHYHGNQAAAETVAAGIVAAGGEAAAIRADVSKRADAVALIGQAAERFGGADILVNNAGQQPVAMLSELGEGDWHAMMAANVAGPFLLVQAVAAHLRKAGKSGAVVNIASIEGHNPAPGHGHYATSKAALLMFT